MCFRQMAKTAHEVADGSPILTKMLTVLEKVGAKFRLDAVGCCLLFQTLNTEYQNRVDRVPKLKDFP